MSTVQELLERMARASAEFEQQAEEGMRRAVEAAAASVPQVRKPVVERTAQGARVTFPGQRPLVKVRPEYAGPAPLKPASAAPPNWARAISEFNEKVLRKAKQ